MAFRAWFRVKNVNNFQAKGPGQKENSWGSPSKTLKTGSTPEKTSDLFKTIWKWAEKKKKVDFCLSKIDTAFFWVEICNITQYE